MPHQAFTLPAATQGNMNFNGAAGLRMTVGPDDIVVSALGAFLDPAAEWTSAKQVVAYRASDFDVLATASVPVGGAGCTMGGQYRLLPLSSPVTIPAGTQIILGVTGYAGDKFQSGQSLDPPVVPIFDGGSGLLTYQGGSYGFGSIPDTPDGNTTYGAATMVYDAASGGGGTTPLAIGALSLVAATPAGISLSWGAATGGTGPYTYKLYRSTSVPFAPPGTGTLVSTGTGTSATDSSPGAGVVWYRLLVADSAGVTAVSVQSSALSALPARLATAAAVLGHIGDSITAGVGSASGPIAAQACANQLAAQGLASPTIVNRGISGTTTGDWLPGGSLLSPALAAFQSAGVTHVLIQLGTNNAKLAVNTSPATYAANLGAICNAVVATGAKVILNGPPYLNLAAAALGYSGVWGEPSLPLLSASYPDALGSIANGTTILLGEKSAWDYFARHPEQLADGVHPNDAGHAALGALWAEGYALATTAGTGGGGGSGLSDADVAKVSAAVWAASGRTLSSFGFTVALSASGLDNISIAPPTAGPVSAWNFRQLVVMLGRRFFRGAKYDKPAKTVTMYADDGVTPICSQPFDDNASATVQGLAS